MAAANTAPRPGLFVVGAAKCGTTSLHRRFELTPAIGTPRTRKELHYFSAPELVAATAGPGDAAIPDAIVRDEAEYFAEYAHLDPEMPVIADVSPSYLQNPPAASRIRDFAPEARIVILLRDPAAKVFSQYLHLWGEGRETLPFEEAWEARDARREAGFSDMFDYASGGFYAEAVKRYLDLFGEDRVRVLLFEEVTADPQAEMARLSAFLGTDLGSDPLPRLNAGGRVRSPVLAALLGAEALRAPLRAALPLSLRTRLSERVSRAVPTERPELAPEMRALLTARFAADVTALEDLLGRETGWPRA